MQINVSAQATLGSCDKMKIVTTIIITIIIDVRIEMIIDSSKSIQIISIYLI